MSKLPITTENTDEADLGPYMRALSPQHRRCVIEYWETNGNRTEAVRRAGFSDAGNSGNSASATAYRIFHREDVQLAIHEEEAKHIRLAAGRAIRYVEQVVDDPKVKPEIRLKAAFDLMNRAGHSAVMQSHLTVEHKLDEAQLDARIIAICAELGISKSEAQKLLIDPGNFVDAEFEEVPRELSSEEIAAKAERDRENERRRELNAMTPDQRAAAKAAVKAQRKVNAKQKYAKAQGMQLDIEDHLDDGTAGLEDILGLIPTQKHAAWRVK